MAGCAGVPHLHGDDLDAIGASAFEDVGQALLAVSLERVRVGARAILWVARGVNLRGAESTLRIRSIRRIFLVS